MGLLGVVDDATYVGTLQNIARATNPIWNSIVVANSGTNRDLTTALLQQAEDTVWTRSSGKVSMICSNVGQRANYVQLATQQRIYVDRMDFDLGWKALDYNGKPGKTNLGL